MDFCTERLYFREFNEHDFHLYESVLSNESVMKYALFDCFNNKDELIPHFTKTLENNKVKSNRESCEYAVFLSSDNSFLGIACIILSYVNNRVTCSEIGYFLLPAFWGQGFATEIAGKLLDICFSDLKIHRVVASCNANNPKSENVMKKIGMKKEGEFRKARFKNGQWDNELRYGILLDEWKA